MSEAKRVYAFESHASAAVTAATTAPGVTIAPRRVASMLNIRGHANEALLSSAFGARITLPREPNTATDAAGTRALWLGPDEWLLVCGDAAPELSGRIGDGSVTDVSHGRALLRVSGPDVRVALARGCALDLHPRVFGVNCCAQTAIAKVSVILDHVQPGVFDLYCSRSYAGSFWHWLIEACSEYRYRVAAPE